MSTSCIDAYKNLNIEIRNNSLAISPCCLTPVKIVDKLDFTNDAYLNDYRTKFNAGEFPSACQQCNQQEQDGHISRRLASNHWYSDHQQLNKDVNLIRLDYWTGDLCNLKCVICGPTYSSSWKEELNIPIKQKTINKFWNNLELNNLKYIHFNGGEPLLVKEHLNFLQAISNKSQVHLNYNTNGTILPSQTLLNLWNEFRLVQIDFSIDDIEHRFEYQRYPAKWTQVKDNLKWFIENCPVNCMFAVNTTVSILNKSNINNLNEWLQNNFFVSCVGDVIQHRTQPAAGLFAVETMNKNRQKILNFLTACDERRGTSWLETFPELIDLITAK